MSVYRGQEKVLNSITAVEEAKVKEAVKANIVTAFSDTPSDEKVPSEKLVKTELAKKVGIETIKYTDTRYVDSPPSYYLENFPMQNVYEFKNCSALGIFGDYGALQTLVCWHDVTAPIHQVLVCSNGIYYRSSNFSTDPTNCTWGSWTKLAVAP